MNVESRENAPVNLNVSAVVSVRHVTIQHVLAVEMVTVCAEV